MISFSLSIKASEISTILGLWSGPGMVTKADLEDIRMKLSEALTELGNIKAALAEGNAEVRAELDKLNAKITELEAMITDEELGDAFTEIVGDIKSIATGIADIIPNPPPPPPVEG